MITLEMKLEEAYTLIEAHGRVIADVAKHYNWKDDADLKDYTDFILHEPAQWMKGYPVKYADPTQFSKPKTALVKLMKHAKVQEEYGIEYTTSVRDAVWNVYKGLTKEKPVEVPKNEIVEEEPVLNIIEDIDTFDTASVHSMKVSKKDRSQVLATALRSLIEAEKEKNPGLVAVSLTLLDAFLTA
jgi:hypothetical protein